MPPYRFAVALNARGGGKPDTTKVCWPTFGGGVGTTNEKHSQHSVHQRSGHDSLFRDAVNVGTPLAFGRPGIPIGGALLGGGPEESVLDLTDGGASDATGDGADGGGGGGGTDGAGACRAAGDGPGGGGGAANAGADSDTALARVGGRIGAAGVLDGGGGGATVPLRAGGGGGTALTGEPFVEAEWIIDDTGLEGGGGGALPGVPGGAGTLR